jgi:hypothetical protein
MYHQIIIGFLEISGEHFYDLRSNVYPVSSRLELKKNDRSETLEGYTVTTHLQINNIPDSDVDDTKETLILLFKFLLIKYLDCEDTIFIDFPVYAPP